MRRAVRQAWLELLEATFGASLAVLCTSDRHPGVRLEEQEVACSQAQRLSVYLT